METVFFFVYGRRDVVEVDVACDDDIFLVAQEYVVGVLIVIHQSSGCCKDCKEDCIVSAFMRKGWGGMGRGGAGANYC